MTRQIRDILLFNEKKYYLSEELLERYFRTFPEKKPEITAIMTALWRGYVATFEIADNELLIRAIDWLSTEEAFSPESFIEDNFPNKKFQWFSGLIRIDDFRGEFDDEENKDAIYELLEINNGDFKNLWKLNHSDFVDFKKMLFEAFKLTEDYDNLVGKWRNNNPKMKKDEIDTYIFKYLIDNVRAI